MNKVLKYVVLVGILLALVLTSACTLRASKPPATQATATSELQFATSTTVSDAVATQTAAVKPAVATATTEPKQAEQATTAPTKAAEVAQSGGGQTTTQNQAQPIPTSRIVAMSFCEPRS